MELGNDLTRIEEERKRFKLVRKLRITPQCFRDLEFVRVKYARYADDSFSGVAGGGQAIAAWLEGAGSGAAVPSIGFKTIDRPISLEYVMPCLTASFHPTCSLRFRTPKTRL